MYMEVKTYKSMQPEYFDKSSYVEFEVEQSNDTSGFVPTSRDPVNVRRFQKNAVHKLYELRN